ncbi:MAG TPA: porin family protein [Chitinophagaceae bacterium]
MKKIMFLTALVVATSFAQAQVSIGVHGNLIGASMKNTEDGQDLDFDNRFSWKGGLVAQVPLTMNVNFLPQLNLLSKGGKMDISETAEIQGVPVTERLKGNAKLVYLELPLNVVYSTGGEEGGFFIGLGPSIGFGLSGEFEGDYTISAAGQSESEPFNVDLKFDGKTEDEVDQNDEAWHFKRLDFGANVIAGYQLSNGFFINAHYNHSFSDIDPNNDIETKNRYFGIGLGYFFGRRAAY